MREFEYAACAANKRKKLDDLLLQKGKQFPINKDCAFYSPKENNCTILKMDYCCYERKCNFFKVKKHVEEESC